MALCGMRSGVRSGTTNSATLSMSASAKLARDEALSDSAFLYANAPGRRVN